jgi:hypothetical protein
MMATTQMAASTAPSIINELDNTVALQRSETEPFGLNWTSYSTPALHDIVTDSIKELTALTRRGQKELRQRLLPALQEVRSRINKGEAVDGYDTMKAYLAAVGLSEDTIRQWEFRLREKELKELGFEVDAAPASVITDAVNFPDTNEAPSDEELQAMAEEAGEATAPLPKKEYAPNTRGSHKVLQELAAQVQAKYGEGTCSVMPMPDGSPINNGVVLLTIPVSVTRAQTLLKESL